MTKCIRGARLSLDCASWRTLASNFRSCIVARTSTSEQKLYFQASEYMVTITKGNHKSGHGSLLARFSWSTEGIRQISFTNSFEKANCPCKNRFLGRRPTTVRCKVAIPRTWRLFFVFHHQVQGRKLARPLVQQDAALLPVAPIVADLQFYPLRRFDCFTQHPSNAPHQTRSTLLGGETAHKPQRAYHHLKKAADVHPHHHHGHLFGFIIVRLRIAMPVHRKRGAVENLGR